jgi:hypothetical protein
LLREPLDDGRNNLLRHDDNTAPLRCRDTSQRQSFMNVRPMPFSRAGLSATRESQLKLQKGDNAPAQVRYRSCPLDYMPQEYVHMCVVTSVRYRIGVNIGYFTETFPL